MKRMSREQYASMFGPTTGDAVRLADTELWAEIEHDYAVYGDCLLYTSPSPRDS